MNLDRETSRRNLLRGTAIAGGALLLAGVAASQYTDSIDEIDDNAPAGVRSPDRPLHKSLLDLLKPGNTVEIWDGSYEIGPLVRRRYKPGVTDIYQCTRGLGDPSWCVDGVDYYNRSRSEQVYAPILFPSKSQSYNLTYFSPTHGLVVWVAVVSDNTDNLIKRNGVLLSDKKNSDWSSLIQYAEIVDVREDETDLLHRPFVLARRQNGNVERILVSQKDHFSLRNFLGF